LLRILSAKKLRAFYETQLGKTSTVIFEHETKGDFMFGFTGNYVKVKHPYSAELINTPLEIILDSFDEEGNVICKLKTEVLV